MLATIRNIKFLLSFTYIHIHSKIIDTLYIFFDIANGDSISLEVEIQEAISTAQIKVWESKSLRNLVMSLRGTTVMKGFSPSQS